MDHLAPFSVVLGFLVLGNLVFEHALWRVPKLHGWFVKRPDLRGTWLVEAEPQWENEEGKKEPPWQGYMAVTQTFSKLQMHLMTPESESWLIADRIQPSRDNKRGYEVIGVYTNKPKMELRLDKSQRHEGAFVLQTHGPEGHPDALDGEYFSDRQTIGQMRLSQRSETLFTRFADAEAAFPDGDGPKGGEA